MPRIKPPRSPEAPPAVEDHTPPTEDIEIVLEDAAPGDAVVDLAAPLTPEPEPRPAAPAVPVPAADDALVRAAEATRRADDLQRQNSELLRQNRERDEELVRERGDREDAEYNSVLTAMAAEQAALDKAESDYAALAAAGDWSNAAKAQRAMSTAAGRLDRLEENKTAFDSKRAAAKTDPPATRQPAPAPQDFESRLSALGVPDNAKAWLRKHPELLDENGRKIGAAHNYLTDVKGVAAFSDAYFDALDDQFGFKAPAAADPDPQPQPQRRSMPVSAPVSRDVPTASGKPASSTKVTLTAEEREIARLSIPDTPGLPKLSNHEKELIYARNRQKYQAQQQERR